MHALVFDLDEDAIGSGSHAQYDVAVRAREPERVLEQVRDHRREDLSIT